MAAKRKGRNSRKWQYIAGAVCLAWIATEGRFYFPRHIRPPGDIVPVEVVMKTTAYCHCRKCCSYKWFLFIPYQKTGFASFRFKHVGKTSSGAMVRPGTIAADTSIYPYGTVMYIPGYGYGRVDDTGGAIKGRHIDLYRPNHWFARHWGVQKKKVKVWLPAAGRPWSFNPIGVATTATTSSPPEKVSETNQTPSPASPEQIPLP
jgi:3D (Asp-Asp-Asp) domain-containing protein